MSDGHWSPGPKIADGAAEDAQADTEHGHVAEIERSLEQSVHSEERTKVRSAYSHGLAGWHMQFYLPGFEEEIVERVEVDISRSRSGRQK